MARVAELFDGTELEFPDNTPDEVVRSTVKRRTFELQGNSPEIDTHTPAPPAPGLLSRGLSAVKSLLPQPAPTPATGLPVNYQGPMGGAPAPTGNINAGDYDVTPDGRVVPAVKAPGIAERLASLIPKSTPITTPAQATGGTIAPFESVAPAAPVVGAALGQAADFVKKAVAPVPYTTVQQPPPVTGVEPGSYVLNPNPPAPTVTETPAGRLNRLIGTVGKGFMSAAPFPGLRAAITQPESPEGQAARNDPGVLLNPMPPLVSELFQAGVDTIRQTFGDNTAKAIQDAMAMFPGYGPGFFSPFGNAARYARGRVFGQWGEPQPGAGAGAGGPTPPPEPLRPLTPGEADAVRKVAQASSPEHVAAALKRMPEVDPRYPIYQAELARRQGGGTVIPSTSTETPTAPAPTGPQGQLPAPAEPMMQQPESRAPSGPPEPQPQPRPEYIDAYKENAARAGIEMRKRRFDQQQWIENQPTGRAAEPPELPAEQQQYGGVGAGEWVNQRLAEIAKQATVERTEPPAAPTIPPGFKELPATEPIISLESKTKPATVRGTGINYGESAAGIELRGATPRETLLKVQGAASSAGPEILSNLPRGAYEDLAQIPQAELRAAFQDDFQKLREHLPEAGQTEAPTVPEVRRPEVTETPSRLQQAPRDRMVVPEVPPGGAQTLQPGQRVELDYPRGERKYGTFEGYTAGGVDEDFQRLNVKLDDGGHVQGGHPNAIRPTTETKTPTPSKILPRGPLAPEPRQPTTPALETGGAREPTVSPTGGAREPTSPADRLARLEQVQKETPPAPTIPQIEPQTAKTVAELSQAMAGEFNKHPLNYGRIKELRGQIADLAKAETTPPVAPETQIERPAVPEAGPAPEVKPGAKPQAAAAKIEGVQKEPWQMTREEYGDQLIAKGQRQQARAEQYRIEKPGFNLYKPQGRKLNKDAAYTISQGLALKKGTLGTFGNSHKIVVESAIKQGKPVPPEVLKDYPDLQPKPAPPINEPTGIAARIAKLEAENAKLRGEKPKTDIEAPKAEQPPTPKSAEQIAKDMASQRGDAWKMTQQEYRHAIWDENAAILESQGKDKLAARARLAPVRDSMRNESNLKINAAHKSQVEDAIKEGKPVPAEVLKDYPELTPEAKTTTPPVPEKPKSQSVLESAIKTAETRAKAEAAAAKGEAERGSVTIGRAKPGEIAPAVRGFINRDLRSRDLTRSSIREQAGEMMRKKFQAEKRLEAESKRWDKASIAESLRFIDKIEQGEPATSFANPADEALAGQLRRLLDERRQEVQDLGTGKLENFIENYFPHIWEKPTQAIGIIQRIMGKRPLEGPASFLKKRTIPTTAEGVRAGLKPVTYNPVELALLKIHEMDRYIMAHKVKAILQEQGLVKFVRFGKKPPDGWTALDDKIFKVLQYSEAEKGFINRGQYYAPDLAAKSFNNYLSPGLAKYGAYRLVRNMGNTLNQAQLGFSAFHLGFTSIDAIISDLGLAIEQTVRGHPIKALKPALRAATLVSPIENAITGNRLLKEYLEPGSYAKLSREASALAEAGGRPFMDPFYKNQAIDNFWKAWKEGNWVRMGLKTVPTVMEYLSKPIMEYIVPRQKLGVFAKLATDVFDRAEEGNWSETRIRNELQKAWDAVDDRMGQIVYDNLFWNRAVKDLSMVSVRSVGWNTGTVRHVGGGVTDTGRLLAEPLRRMGETQEETSTRYETGRHGGEFSHRMAYIIALPIVVGYLGLIYNYLATGEMPKEPKDYFFPRTGGTDANGREERVSLPSYMKDIYAFSKHPLTTIGHKVQPVISALIDMINNEDFYGTEIRHPGDPLVRQVQDIMGFIAKQFTPFSVRNAEQRAKAVGEEGFGATLKEGQIGKTAQSFVGITPAPASVTKTDAEEMASDFLSKRTPVGPRTKEEADRRDTARMLERRYKLGNATKDELDQAVKEGKITHPQELAIIRRRKEAPLLATLRHLRADESLKVWEVATPEEQKQIKPFVRRKLQNLNNYSREEALAIRKKARSLPGLLSGTIAPAAEPEDTAVNE